jgi:hypothetical protein
MPNAIDVHRIADQIEESFQQILAAVEILTMQQTQPAPSGSSLATGSDSPELTLTNAGWVRRGYLWVSPYTGNAQSFRTAHCIEQMQACDRESPNAADQQQAGGRTP